MAQEAHTRGRVDPGSMFLGKTWRHQLGKPFNYGGQAVLEGVMMRGSRTMAVALRHPDGHIVVNMEPVNETLYCGPISRTPFWSR